MTATLATLAFILALGALWFTCEVARRSDVRNKTVLRPHLEPVNEALQQTESHIRDLTHSLEAMEREVKNLKMLREEFLAESISSGSDNEGEYSPPKWQGESVDESTPNFRPTATYNA